jgi:hypothetical protein
MAPPRTKRLDPGEGHQLLVKLRLPPDVLEMIDAKARENGWTLNRTIINLLASLPHLDREARSVDAVRQLEILLHDMAARMTWLKIEDELLNAVDAALAAPANAPAALDKLRAARAAMLLHERQMKKRNTP